MGNRWSFTLYLSISESPAVLIRQVIDIIISSEFTTDFETLFSAIVFDNQGNDHRFSDEAMMVEFVAAHGGLIAPFWYHGDDIGLQFRVSPAPTISMEINWKLHEEHKDFVTHLLKVYERLIETLAPAYGCVYDEWGSEDKGIVNQEPFDACLAAVIEKRPVPYLFWINYFPNDYLAVVGAECFTSVTHSTQTSHGQLLFSTEWPWQAKIAVRDTNGIYRK